jgi:hypothetical protein
MGDFSLDSVFICSGAVCVWFCFCEQTQGVSKKKSVPLRHVGPKGEVKYSLHLFLTTALDGVSCRRHAPAVLYPRGKDPR